MRIGSLILVLAVACLLLAGCTHYPDSVIPAQPSADSSAPYIPSSGGPPADRTWISPGKVEVGNFYPGARAEWNVTIHNGKAEACPFTVSYRYPDHVGVGYDNPPSEAKDWVIIADSNPILAAQETKDILIALDMPKGAEVASEKWEFWISVVDTSQQGTVVTELCTRWLVNMR